MRMNYHLHALLHVVIITLVSTVSAQEEDRPNFIFIFTDDLGFGDLPLNYGHPYAETPNLSRLQKEGTSFMQFSATGNVCPNSRAGLMTSCNPSLFPNYTKDYGFKGKTTVTQVMKQAGYLTGHIGKWHIGPKPDTKTSYHEEYGIDDLRLAGSIKNDPRGREGERFDEAVAFLEDHKDDLFYLNLWVWSPHASIDPPKSFIDHFKDLKVDRDLFGEHMQEKFDEIENLYGDIDESMRIYLAEIYAFDLQVGRLLNKLDELKLTQKTVVVFSSDNGPDTADTGKQYIGYSGGLRGEKSTYYEGGMRVPFIVRWPGKVPAGKVDNESLMFGLDWLPTVGTLGRADIPWDGIEGEDMSQAWLGKSQSRQKPLFYRGLKKHDHVYMRYGQWKLHKEEKELYDLKVDPEEWVNVYDKFPDVVEALLKSMEAWEKTLPAVHVRLPDDPVPFDPMEAVPEIPLPKLPVGVASGEAALPANEQAIPSPTVPAVSTPTASPLPKRKTLSPAVGCRIRGSGGVGGDGAQKCRDTTPQ